MHTFSFFFFSLNLFDVLLFLCFVLFCFFLLLVFQADTSLFLLHLIVENLILHIHLIIMIIIPCSGMFRKVPECSGMFRNVPCSWFYRRPPVWRKIEKFEMLVQNNGNLSLFLPQVYRICYTFLKVTFNLHFI